MKCRQFSLSHWPIFLFLAPVILFGAAACSGRSASYAPVEEPQTITAPEREVLVAEDGSGETAAPDNGSSPIANVPNVYNRLILKNAELELMVEDTDTAIDRAMGIVTEYRGYVVSNRTWFSGGLKQATLTIGVPVDNFEEMLRRLKDLAINVSGETVTGQDVTDEFVDLESRLRNLEATANRIRDFLAKAEDVEESLQVSYQLSEVEAQIEQVKGRMAYLKDRAAFSTITLQISAQPPQPTPTPSPAPVPWSVNRTVGRATGVTNSLATLLFQLSVELLVWFVVVILPFMLPVVGLIWLATRLLRRVGVRPTIQGKG